MRAIVLVAATFVAVGGAVHLSESSDVLGWLQLISGVSLGLMAIWNG